MGGFRSWRRGAEVVDPALNPELIALTSPEPGGSGYTGVVSGCCHFDDICKPRPAKLLDSDGNFGAFRTFRLYNFLCRLECFESRAC